MSDVNKLMEDATKQLAEHVEWLVAEIKKIPADVGMQGGVILLCEQARMIKLRMARAISGNVSVVWEYPDELAAFLRSPGTPKHIRDTLAGGHVVNTEQPAFTAKRTYTND